MLMVTVGIAVPLGSGLDFFKHHINVCAWFCLLEANDRSFHTVPQAVPPHSMPGLAFVVGSLLALLQRMGQVSGPAQTRSTSSQMPRAHTVLGCTLRVPG